jgi:predicted ATPase
MEAMSSDFAKELQRCFGTSVSDLGRRSSDLERRALSVSFSEAGQPVTWRVKASADELKVAQFDVPWDDIQVAAPHYGPPLGYLSQEPETFVHYSVPEIIGQLLSSNVNRAFYLPASRSGILLGHKTLVSLIVGRSSLAWLEPMEIPRLPGVVTDLIQALLLLGQSKQVHDKMNDVVAFLEKNIADGVIDVDRNNVEYPEIYYQNARGKFYLHQASSMVSEIAPLVLFLKYLVRPGYLFIIEEPESHLDAQNQRILAQAIAQLVRVGVKVLVTTHSDYFVNQLNNLLLLSQLPARRRTPQGYSANIVLNAEDVGAYLFTPGVDGTVVESLDIDASKGISVERFAQVHRELYNEAIRLERTTKR